MIPVEKMDLKRVSIILVFFVFFIFIVIVIKYNNKIF